MYNQSFTSKQIETVLTGVHGLPLNVVNLFVYSTNLHYEKLRHYKRHEKLQENVP